MNNKVLLLFLCLLSTSSAMPLSMRHLSNRDGLSQLSVMSIYQDETGRLWFGTYEGLSVYDGHKIQSIKPAPDKSESTDYQRTGLLRNECFPITGDGRGYMYVVSNASLLRYNLLTEQFESLIDSHVRTVVHHTSRQLLVGLEHAVCRWNQTTQQADAIFTLGDCIVQTLFIDSHEALWVGTQQGLFRSTDWKNLTLVADDLFVNKLYEDSTGRIWVATRHKGVWIIDHALQCTVMSKDSTHGGLAHNQVRDIVEDDEGNIWIATFKGLNCYHPTTDRFDLYLCDAFRSGDLASSSVYALRKDRQGTIWAGTYFGGVYYFNPQTDIFTTYYPDADRPNRISHPYVGHMLEDRDQNLWIATEGGGLNCFSRGGDQTIKHYRAGDRYSIAHDNVKSLCYSQPLNRLYLGTHMGGLSVLHIDSGVFQNMRDYAPVLYRQIGKTINQVQLYNESELIILSQTGMFLMNIHTWQVRQLFNSDHCFMGHLFYIDSKARIWIAHSTAGLYCYDLKTEQLRSLYVYGTKGLGDLKVISMAEDSDGVLFAGAAGSGLFAYHEESDSFERYTVDENHLLSNYCYNITPLSDGRLIISGDKGLSFMNRQRQTYRIVELGGMLPLSGIDRGHGLYICGDGEIFVGGVNGMVSFREADFERIHRNFRLYFSELDVKNERVFPGAVIAKALPFVDQIRLKHHQNDFQIKFTTDNYLTPLRRQTYEYKLDGFDEAWKVTDNPIITYTGLKPGEYRLTVRERHVQAGAACLEASMKINIAKPWWTTWWAFMLYAGIVLATAYRFYHYQTTTFRLRTRLKFEQQDKEHKEQLRQTLLQFFAQVSNELHAPLNHILQQTELLLLDKENMQRSVRLSISDIQKTTMQLTNLVCELFKFRLTDKGQIELHMPEQTIQEKLPFDAQLLITDQVADGVFLNKVNVILDANIHDPDFDVVALANAMGLSRSTLFAKFKDEASFTPAEYIIQFRLKRACLLLMSNKDMQIAEIAEHVGFLNPKHFTRVFKGYFNMTPTEYRKT